MGTTKTRAGQGLGYREPSLAMVVLRACPSCDAPHPRARNLDTDTCPDCGTNCPTGERREVPAMLSGLAPWALAARLFLWLGKSLTSLARSI